jgi:hypothetical protein
MSGGTATAGTSFGSQLPPNKEFEADKRVGGEHEASDACFDDWSDVALSGYRLERQAA